MNRKQRRAEKKKHETHDPAFMVHRSDMRAHLDRILRNDPVVQQAIQEEAHRVNLEEAKKQDMDILTLILMSLHRREGFGRKRLLRFCHNFNELQKYYSDFFKDLDMFAMRRHLRDEVGIDVEKINEEVAKFLDENPDER